MDHSVFIKRETLVEIQSHEVARARFKENKYNTSKNSDIAKKYSLFLEKAKFCYCFLQILPY